MLGKWMCVVGLAVVCASWAAAQDAVTTIELTDKVLVEDCGPFGINLGGDAYYSGAAVRKKRAEVNFEGSTYRQCHWGPVWKENGASTWFGVPDHWKKIFIGQQYTILSGPAKGTTGKLKDVITVPYKHQGKMIQQPFLVFDKTVPVGPANGGVMIESFRLDEGQIGPLDGHWRKNLSPSIGDVPPGSFGVAACNLDGRTEQAHIRFSTHYQRYGQTNGTWHVHFWAKAKSGAPELKVSASRDEYGESKNVAPAAEWQKHEVELIVDKVPEPSGPKDNPHLTFVISATDGQALIDDVEIWLEGDENPTAFRDDVVNMLKTYGPGCVRFLQMGGNTVRNTLMPRLKSHSYTSRKWSRPGPYERHRKTPYGLHEMYELCQYIGAEPWYCLPGTLNQQEMADFMEYLGGPEDTEYGKLRVEMGQIEPWAEVFSHIHVEFGNEAWNNAGPYQLGGFNGPDYWNDLIALAKKSSYYRENIVFHSAGQAASSGRNQRIMANCPNADRHSVAPYIIQGFSKQEIDEVINTDDKFFRWAFAWPMWRSLDKDGAMFQNFQYAQAAGKELSIYEVNHHTTHGDGPLEPRNKLVTSIGGGLNVANCMLLMLKEHHLRTQALFSLVQHSYSARGIGRVRLWGTALNMRKGHERYRPTFLACATANKVMSGDLVATVHTGADPRFSATGVFSRRKGVQTISDIPVLRSYAFGDGQDRGLIVINLDTQKVRAVAVKFAGKAADSAAQLWLLTADKITGSNEFEQPEPQVTVTEEKLTDFASGTEISIRPFSMLALKWRVE